MGTLPGMATKQTQRRRAQPLKAKRTVDLTDLSVEVSTVDEALHAYDAKFLDCRDLRHSWIRQGYWSEGGHVKRRLMCQRCGTTRTDVWSFDGRERFSGSYDYVDNYLLTGMDGHARPTDVRAEIMERATVYGNEAEMLAHLTRNGGRKK